MTQIRAISNPGPPFYSMKWELEFCQNPTFTRDLIVGLTLNQAHYEVQKTEFF